MNACVHKIEKSIGRSAEQKDTFIAGMKIHASTSQVQQFQ